MFKTPTRQIEKAFSNAQERAKRLGMTVLVVEGCGGYYTITEEYWAAQDDKDELIARVYPSGKELWAER